MRFLVTPTFTQKLGSFSGRDLAEISFVVNVIKVVDRSSLTNRVSGLEVRFLDSSILTIKRGRFRIYASFGSDSDGEYLLLLDIGLEGAERIERTDFFAAKDPRKNPLLDPNKNMTIDPRRNMTIDPNRNMTIDPRRNMTIDPNRNMTIDPRRNRFYGGPYLYGVSLEQEGFVVRADDRVTLIFDTSARFTSFIVFSESGFGNVFDLSSCWIGFLVPTQSDSILRFDTSGQWLGIIV